jgi:hypothetical protein
VVKMAWILVFTICLMSLGLGAEAAVKPQSVIRTQAAFNVPAGWSDYEDMILGEPVLTLSRGLYTIQVYLFGGPDSRHETPEEFLSSWEARDETGQPPRQLGSVLVGGTGTLLYARTFSMSGKERDMPDEAALERTYREEFIIVPASQSFFVLTFTVPVEPPAPPDRSVDTAWKEFFKSFRPKLFAEESSLDKVLQYKIPSGWRYEKGRERWLGPDPTFKLIGDRGAWIRVTLYGLAGSQFRTPGEFRARFDHLF